MAVSAFRRSAATEAKQKGGKGGKGAWYEKLRLPQQTPTPVLIMHGSYLDRSPPASLVEVDPTTGQAKPVINDYAKIKKHTRKLMNGSKQEFRDEPCSAGLDPHNPQPCAGCQAMDLGDKSVTVKDAFLFTVVHLAPYHIHPMLDRQTRQIVQKQDGSGPVMVFSECEGRTCNFCRVARGEQPYIQQGDQWPGWQANQFTTEFGHRRYLEVGKSHLSDLDGFEQSISSICANPACGNQLTTDGYRCPTCKTMLIDMERDPRSDAQILDAVMAPYPCHTCQRGVLLEEVVSCEFCAAAGRQMVRTSLFDNVLYLFRQGEGTKSHIMMQRYQSLDSFGQQLSQMGWLRDGKTIQQLVADLGKPYDFEKMFEPRSIEEQVKKLQLQPQRPPPSQYGAYPGAPQYGAPPMQQGYPPGQPAYPAPGAAYGPPQTMGYVPPGPGTAAPAQHFMPPAGVQQPQGYSAYPPAQNNAGPAPFQPAPRTNFGS
jgi:hypothetical protein